MTYTDETVTVNMKNEQDEQGKWWSIMYAEDGTELAKIGPFDSDPFTSHPNPVTTGKVRKALAMVKEDNCNGTD